MLVKNVVGGIMFYVLWLGIVMFGITFHGGVSATEIFAPEVSMSAEGVSDTSTCGVNTADYGSGVVKCDGSITAWVSGDNSSSIYSDDYMEKITTVFDSGVASVLTVDKVSGTISAYIG